MQGIHHLQLWIRGCYGIFTSGTDWEKVSKKIANLEIDDGRKSYYSKKINICRKESSLMYFGYSMVDLSQEAWRKMEKKNQFVSIIGKYSTNFIPFKCVQLETLEDCLDVEMFLTIAGRTYGLDAGSNVAMEDTQPTLHLQIWWYIKGK